MRGNANAGAPRGSAYARIASVFPYPPSGTRMATTSYPRMVNTSNAVMVVDMPPSAPSPTSTAGRRMGRYASHWSDPEGAGEHTPPAVSTSATPAPPSWRNPPAFGPTMVSANCAR